MTSLMTNLVQLLFRLCQMLIRGAKSTARVMPRGVFVYELIRKPGAVGAICASSGALARAMAEPVSPEGRGLVVELGAGTGAVTKALLERGIPAERLLVIEQSHAFVHHLRRRFPSVRIIQGDAAALDALLPKESEVKAIVSSLPLRSIPSTEVMAITDQWRQLLPSQGVLVQFTYDLRRLNPWVNLGFDERGRQLVWKNMPPACVVPLSRAMDRDEAGSLEHLA